MSKVIRAILITIIAAFLMSEKCAYAGNALRLLGFSGRDLAMAGATTASSEDTSCMVRNPAGLARIGTRADVEYMNIIPHDVTMHTEGVLSNAGKIQKSTVTYIPGVDSGFSYRVPGTEKHPIALGCGVFTISGVAVAYPAPRVSERRVGDYDRKVDLRHVRITPGMAVAITDKIDLGATANIALQALRADLTKQNFQETAGQYDWDIAPGAGFTLGILYKFNEMLGLGASYESHTWMGYHDKYKDILHLIDQPQLVNFGLSFKPVKNFEFTYDTRYINWTDVKLARQAPKDGGFGWKDQWVFAAGSEYTVNDKLKMRLGYVYGKSPIQPHVVFANALMPVITEHHLTAGFSYFIRKNISINLAWEHAFKNVLSDNGSGDIYSIEGNGTKITAAADIIGVGIGYKF